MRRAVPAAIGLALLPLVAAACGSVGLRGTEPAGLFMTRILREELNGQWARQWSELHPGHQKLITRAEYVACSRTLATNIGTGNETYRVLSVKDVPLHVANVPQTKAKLVRISFHVAGNSTTPTFNMHAVAVDGHWKWILGGRFLNAVEHGHCLDGTPLAKLTHVPS